MSQSDNDQENVFKTHFKPNSRSHRSRKSSKDNTATSASTDDAETNDQFSPTLTWPILLAVVPTLGAFFVGSAELWSDFIMLLLILYYVYKWLTVPWTYYESARSRRAIHDSVLTKSKMENPVSSDIDLIKSESIATELRRHEFAGLIWVTLSPVLAGYTLHYSRSYLSSADKYISTFNISVFVLAALIKPLSHIMTLVQDRTLYLQSELVAPESELQSLKKRFEVLDDEVHILKEAYATKKDLGQIADDINPAIHHLAKTLRRIEKRENALKDWAEEQFTSLETKMREFDEYICYRIEQDQRQEAHGGVASLMLIPLNISFWAAKRMTTLLPIHHGNLLSSSASDEVLTDSSEAQFKSDKSLLNILGKRPNTKELCYPTEGASVEPTSST